MDSKHDDLPESLNIDTMLESLADKLPEQVKNHEHQQQQALAQENFLSSSSTLFTNQLQQLQKLPSKTKKIISAALTVVVLIIGAWVLSVQYPEETTALIQGANNIFSRMMGSVSNNRNPEGPLVKDTPATDYSVNTPLSDAIEQAQNTSGVSNQADDLLGQIVSGSTSSASHDTLLDDMVNSGDTTIASTRDPHFDLPETSLPSLSDFVTRLTTLRDQANNALESYLNLGSADQAKLRMIIKNTKDNLAQLRQTKEVSSGAVQLYHSMNDMYQAVMVQ